MSIRRASRRALSARTRAAHKGRRFRLPSAVVESARRRVKNSLKKLSTSLFLALDPIGLHVLPKHFYTPVPDITWLRKNRDAWQSPASMRGLHWDLDQQLAWLRELSLPYYSEVEGRGIYDDIVDQAVGPGYGPIESQVLHCFIRSNRPRRVIEIGSGASTVVMLHASELNRQEGAAGTAINCIEPHPKPAFSSVTGISHIRELCQNVPGPVFDELSDGDLLFVDSSHSVKVGSELPRIYLEVIPNLRPGVFVHIHDIYLPYLYPREAIGTYFGWQETVLLLALLLHNPHLSVLCSMSALHYGRSRELQALLGDYCPQLNDEGLASGDVAGKHFPSSIWLKTS